MRTFFLISFAVIASFCNTANGFSQSNNAIRENLPLDSIRLSDPFVFADNASKTYYMTGTGGRLWKSKDLALWTGPYKPFVVDPESWMGPSPMVWAAEIHKYKGKYYFFATFTKN